MSINTLEERREDGIGTTEDSPKSSCSECGSIEIVRDNNKGEIICAGCGLVLSDHRIDHG
ncbi:MAG: TFIIB-type zinc ribbon-containing protein, partial [Candidatus Thorarchaeota archaeon]